MQHLTFSMKICTILLLKENQTMIFLCLLTIFEIWNHEYLREWFVAFQIFARVIVKESSITKATKTLNVKENWMLEWLECKRFLNRFWNFLCFSPIQLILPWEKSAEVQNPVKNYALPSFIFYPLENVCMQNGKIECMGGNLNKHNAC